MYFCALRVVGLAVALNQQLTVAEELCALYLVALYVAYAFRKVVGRSDRQTEELDKYISDILVTSPVILFS